MSIRLLALAACIVAVTVLLIATANSRGAIAAPGDVSISALSCDTAPEFVRIHNYGSSSQSLSGFHIQSDPSQDYDLSTHVASIAAGQTLEFQSGSGAADNAGAGIYKLTGSSIYRNSDATDYARLVRSDATTNQVNCGTNPTAPPTSTHSPTVTPAHTPSPTPTHTPSPTPAHTPTPTQSPTPPPTQTRAATPTPTVSPSPTPTHTSPPEYAPGDNDCDGTITTNDALVLLHRLAIPPPANSGTPCRTPTEDANCDGITDARDVLAILYHVANIAQLRLSCGPTPTPSGSAEPLIVHHIDTEQGNAALIIAPDGETAMIDFGRWTNCPQVVSYVESVGVTSIEYAFATHYDADHIGCLDDLKNAGIPVTGACYDRGDSGPTPTTNTYQEYVAACGDKRQTATKGQIVSLGESGGFPVTLTVVDLNGAGVSTTDENALSLDLKLIYGAFDHEFGGDLPGDSPDIESIVGPDVGHVEVYTVHHHGTKYSSNDNWLNDTTPEVGILSVGGNPYGHPTAEALGRLHAHGVHTYWTNVGSGVAPDPTWDKVGGTITISALPQAGSVFTVSGDGFSDSYPSN